MTQVVLDLKRYKYRGWGMMPVTVVIFGQKVNTGSMLLLSKVIFLCCIMCPVLSIDPVTFVFLCRIPHALTYSSTSDGGKRFRKRVEKQITKKKVRKKIRKRYYIKNKVLYYSWCCTYATTHREGYSSRHCAEAFLGR